MSKIQSSVTISGDKTVVSNEGGSQNHKSIQPEKVVQPDNLEAKTMGVKFGTGDHRDGQVEDLSVQRTTSNAQSGLTGEWGTIQTPQGYPEADISKVTPKHSIKIGGVRGTIGAFMQMGMVARSESGELIILDQSGDDGQETEKQTPLHKTEDLKYAGDKQDLNYLNSKVSSNITDSFIARIAQAIVSDNGTEGQKAVTDFASYTGESEAQIEEFGNRYVNNLVSSALDYTVRQSEGTLSSDQIEAHIAKCSPQFQKTLIVGMHHNDLSLSHELVKMVREGRIA